MRFPRRLYHHCGHPLGFRQVLIVAGAWPTLSTAQAAEDFSVHDCWLPIDGNTAVRASSILMHDRPLFPWPVLNDVHSELGQPQTPSPQNMVRPNDPLIVDGDR